MADKQQGDVIIIGGSYSGLSAAMALGRSLRRVWVIDSGEPCNQQTPHSHNFLTQDGNTPAAISQLARQQLERYETVHFCSGLATSATQTEEGFTIHTQAGDSFSATKLIFATGIRDIMPDIEGFAACWGISLIHCPYCHGYEVKHAPTGILGNGDYGFEFSKMIHNWTQDLRLFTNGKSTLSIEQTEKLALHNIPVIETEVERIAHTAGKMEQLVFKDGSSTSLTAMYTQAPFVQHSDIPVSLGCELTEAGYIQVDFFQQTTVPGVFACGDNTTFMRSVSHAVAMGTTAGAMVNRELIDEAF